MCVVRPQPQPIDPRPGARRGNGTRCELRSPDPSCNPYLALAVQLAAGLGRMEKDYPPPPVNQNIYAMSPQEREQLGIRSLPKLTRCPDAMEQDDLLRNARGTHLYSVHARKRD